jgi:thiamine transport system permease protein
MLKLKSNNLINLSFIVVIAFFVIFIFLPTVYILKNFSSPEIFFNPLILTSVLLSFLVGLVVTLFDLIFGVPLAFLLVRSKNKIFKVIDNLVDLSLVMPTAALGFSIYLYWGSNFGLSGIFGSDHGLIAKGVLMIILLHIVFTLPYVIRSTAAAIAQIDQSREEAAETLGANVFTIFHTITLPLARDGIINGSILAFTRSLSETGATMMVAGIFSTAPVLVISLKEQGKLSEATGASIILILSAIIILFLAKRLLGERTINIEKIYPKFEESISRLSWLKNSLLITIFTIFIFLPTIYIVLYYLAHIGVPDLSIITKSIIISFVLAFLVTFINAIFSIPMAYLIARNWLRSGKLFDSLNEIVLLMPTSALGLSLALFWKQFIGAEYLILIFAHLSFTFPLLVKPIATAIRNISFSQEEAAYISGASKFKTFITIILPQIKPAIIAGAIMAFMRSISETGATLAVTDNIKTASILIVDLFKKNQSNEAAFICVIMFLIAFVFLVLLKRNKYN